MSYLALNGIRKDWPGFSLSLSLQAERGEYLSILGPSGAGKSSLLRLICGLEAPDSGRIELGGADITALSPDKRGIGMLFQDLALFPHYSAGGNVAYGLRVKGLAGKKLRETVDAALRDVSLEGFARRRVQTLSGGERQRVALARSLAVGPSVLLLDEPFSALDLPLRQKLGEDLSRLSRERGILVIAVSHDAREAFSRSDRIVIMERGQIEEEGKPEEILSSPRGEFARSLARSIG